ncbi:unnamed protein product [Lasius platythorax]|uniref:Uncharacterized protein n=1 Tax=Lasius platythorax TaxID=488582 RepID=A0AAV2P582_9HYME
MTSNNDEEEVHGCPQMTKGIKGTKGGEEEGPMREKEKENEKDTMDERRGMDEKNEVMALSEEFISAF